MNKYHSSHVVKLADDSFMQCFTCNIPLISLNNSWIKVPYPISFPNACDVITCSSDYVQLNAKGVSSLAISTHDFDSEESDKSYCYVLPRYSDNFDGHEYCTVNIIAIGR